MHRFLPLVLLLLLPGCIVRSFHPLYTDRDVVFEPALLGEWIEEKEDGKTETWTFTKEEKQPNYQVVYTDNDGKQGAFEAHLVKVQGRFFLDLFPADPELTQNCLYQLHLMPVHTFLWVRQTDPTLWMSIMDAEWLEKHLESEPDAIAHVASDEAGILLTAPTEELQTFVVKHTATEGAFEKPSNLKRKGEGEQGE